MDNRKWVSYILTNVIFPSVILYKDNRPVKRNMLCYLSLLKFLCFCQIFGNIPFSRKIRIRLLELGSCVCMGYQRVNMVLTILYFYVFYAFSAKYALGFYVGLSYLHFKSFCCVILLCMCLTYLFLHSMLHCTFVYVLCIHCVAL